jgi:CubicO group peptidase (beta-lactamase class C family)
VLHLIVRKELERVSPESVGIPSSAVNGLIEDLAACGTEMHGLMIARHGKVAAEGWWAPYAPGQRHAYNSFTKTFVATAIAFCIQEERLTLDTRAVDIFPEYAPKTISDKLNKLTVRNMLRMSTGMTQTVEARPDWIRAFLECDMPNEPGTKFFYNSTGSTFLAATVKKLTGLNVIEYLTPRLFVKTGINYENMRWLNMPDGHFIGGGGLYGTTEDQLRLMIFWLNRGVWNGERLLYEGWFDEATRVQIDSSNSPDIKETRQGYQFQTWKCSPPQVYRADGALGQLGFVMPHLDMVVATNQYASYENNIIQHSQECVYRFMEKVAPDALPVDPEASARLRDRLLTLSLKRPDVAPYAPMREIIDNKTCDVDGPLTFFPLRFMDGGKRPLFSSLRFDFTCDGLKLAIPCEDGLILQLFVATDGTRAFNRLNMAMPYSKLMLNGWWEGDTFVLETRWIETPSSTYYRFAFSKDGRTATVTQAPLPRFGSAEPIIVTAR